MVSMIQAQLMLYSKQAKLCEREKKHIFIVFDGGVKRSE